MARKLTTGTRKCSLCDRYAYQRIKHAEYYCELHYQEYQEEQRKQDAGGSNARD